MSFSVEWLTLREPFDHAARSTLLAERFAEAVRATAGTLKLVELGGGTGSGIRWLGPHLPRPQSWTLVDHDPALLATVDQHLATPLAHDLRSVDTLDLDVHGVTCQALLDLVDIGFLHALADWIVARRIPVLAALTVDGRVQWTPSDPSDPEVGAAFRVHQLTDRGFGLSPGPFASTVFDDLLTTRGYTVQREPSDWQIPASATAMLTAMVQGTAQAATEVHPDPDRVKAWHARRLEQIRRGVLSLTVGHTDLFAHHRPRSTYP